MISDRVTLPNLDETKLRIRFIWLDFQITMNTQYTPKLSKDAITVSVVLLFVCLAIKCCKNVRYFGCLICRVPF